MGLLFGLLVGGAQAQCFDLLGGGPGGRRWYVIETPHFRLVYPASLDTLATQVAAVAEASHAALAAWFGRALQGKPRLYLSDADDIANGLAVPLGDGYSCIWLYGNEPEAWTGTTPWLKRVVPHELAHLFHYQAVRSQPAWLNLLLGRPLPRFWTEGLAQYTTESWDAQRGERWLRIAVLDDALSYEDGRSRWNGRLLYAVGHAQTRWLAWQQGDTTLRRILAHRVRRLGVPVHDFYAAFRAVTGTSYHTFYERWRRHVNVLYNTMAGQMETPDSLRGDTLAVPVAYVDDLAPSPDTTRWAVLGLPSMTRPVRTLYVGRPGRWRTVAEGDIRPPVAWSPDGRWVAFARRARGPTGGLVYDLWLASADGRVQRRLTRGRRAFSPTFAPDGRRLAFITVSKGYARLEMLDLQTGTLQLLWTSRAPVHIGMVRWSPDGQALVFDRFVEGVRRDLVLWRVEEDSLIVLTSGRYDDRAPVWSPDGQRLAFTSLRDGVPNVFVVDRATRRVARVTRLVAGARVLAWLPPAPGFPEGRLVVAVTLSKYGESVRLIDARRRAIERKVVVPEPYQAWRRQVARPRRMLDSLPTSPILMSAPKPYRPWANLTHVASLAVPYYLKPFGGGIGGFTLWLEPLGYHTIAAGGMLSLTRLRYSWGWISYLTRRFWGMVGGTLFRWISPSVRYDHATLIEAQTGGVLGIVRNLPAPPYGRRRLSAYLRYWDRRPVWPRHPERLQGPLPPPETGRQLDVVFKVRLWHRRPYRYHAVHPLDGAGVRFRILGSVPVLGATLRFVRLDVAAYRIWPVIGSHRLLTYGRVQAQRGHSLPQDYLGLARSDALHLLLPDVEPEIFAPSLRERVRGYRRLAAGRLVLFGSVEYRLPLHWDLQTELLGLLRLGTTALAVFADGAVVRGGMDTDRLGVGVEMKSDLHLGPFVLTHALGWAYPLSPDEPGARRELYYRIRATVPF
ncbi:hypothetical protein [Rhodothermus profundi]|nr:hypothetical protein [Rhodothermus profundi]